VFYRAAAFEPVDPTMAREDEDMVQLDMKTTEEALAGEPSAKLTVAWADGSLHGTSLPEGNCTRFPSSAGTVTELPLKPKFAEEGSTAAAVRCENNMSATRVNTVSAAEATATTLSPVAFVPNNINTSTLLSEEVRGREPACEMFEQSQQQRGISISETHEEVEPQENYTTTSMGSEVDDIGSLNDESISVQVSEERREEEGGAQDSVPFKGESLSFPTTTGGVLLPPSLRVDSADEVFALRSMSMSEDTDDEKVASMLTLSMGPSNDEDDGIILPPSYSNISVNSSNTMSPSKSSKINDKNINNNNNTTSNVGAFSQLLSLPIDSLHCVASFLTPMEWAQYGLTCTTASKICREIFRRVRMHGFHCATEVVTAWVSALKSDGIAGFTPFILFSQQRMLSGKKLKHLADAKELVALYISAGVPIYPYSMGHSYHTLCWRMGIEAKKMQADADAATETDSTNAGGRSIDESANAVDRYYNERNTRARDVTNLMCSYVEDKAMFFNPSPANPTSPAHGRWGSLGSFPTANREPLVLPPVLPNAVGGAAAGGQPQIPPDARLHDFRPLNNASPTSSPATSPARSLSQSESRTKAKPLVPVSIHRHLLDQHLLGRSCVDDDNGDMKTLPVSLSADFFHPHLSVHSISTHSRPLSLQTSPSPSPFAAASSSNGANLLQDPAFQAWAARAAATVHSRLGGAAADGAEELAELQDLYSQIFAVDRNGATVPVVSVGNTENGHPEGPPRAQAPQMPLGSPQRSIGSGSLDDSALSSLSPRHGQSKSILSTVDLEVYSVSCASAKDKAGNTGELKRQLRTRYTFYQRRLEVLLLHGDSTGYEECILDFWDEFFPLSAKIHYYDRHTAVPRISSLQQFLTQPCPKEIGIVQCEIERVKISSKKRKGVSMKGRLFPTYDYRLFIKDRQHGKAAGEAADSSFSEDNGIRKDTVLMVAKNRGRKHVDTPGVVSLTPAAKRGANNYYLYTPQQADVDTHFNAINETDEEVTGNNNGVSLSPSQSSTTNPPMLLGRLQSNFIGTEFQIYTPKLRKSLPSKLLKRCMSMNEAPLSFDDDAESECGAASDTGSSGRRRSRFGRLTLRRSNSHAASSDPATPSPASSWSRSRSQKESSNVRALRTNRRAIANATDAAPDIGSETPVSQQPFLCEEEDGVITYTANLLGSRPRIMDVCIPKISSDGNIDAEWRNYLENNDASDDCAPYNRMLHCFKQLQQRLESQNEVVDRIDDDENGSNDDFGLLALQNRPPWWNIELGSFVLNFRGRVSVASVKNFQLCDRNDHDHIMLQFGRIQGRHSFTMDYQYPLTAVQAFSIAISSLQSKISFG
jgi:Tub family